MSVNAVLDRARRHAAQLKEIPVPEWTEPGEETFIVRAKAVKARTYNTARQLATDGNGFFDQIRFSAIIVAYCALDANGARLFDDSDWEKLLESADADTLTRIGTLLVASKKSLEALEKN